jgi:hypothetical protein
MLRRATTCPLVILSDERSEESKDQYTGRNPSQFVIPAGTSDSKDLLFTNNWPLTTAFPEWLRRRAAAAEVPAPSAVDESAVVFTDN